MADSLHVDKSISARAKAAGWPGHAESTSSNSARGCILPT